MIGYVRYAIHSHYECDATELENCQKHHSEHYLEY
jgi:hypothetical protein